MKSKNKNIKTITLPKEAKRVSILSNVVIIANNFFQSIAAAGHALPIPVTEAVKYIFQTNTDILLAAYSSQEIERRLRILIVQLNKNFQTLQKEIDFKKEIDSATLEKTFRETIRTSTEEKIKIFANVLTYILTHRTQNNERSAFLHDIFDLEIDHVLFLSRVKNYLDTKNPEQPPFPKIEEVGSLLNFNQAYSHKIASDLLNLGIVTDPRIGTYDYGGFQQVGISHYGLQFIESIKNYEV